MAADKSNDGRGCSNQRSNNHAARQIGAGVLDVLMLYNEVAVTKADAFSVLVTDML